MSEEHLQTFSLEGLEPLHLLGQADANLRALESRLGVTIVLHGIAFLLKKGVGTTEGLIERLERREWQEQLVRSLNTAPARTAGRARLEAAQAFYQQARDEFDGEDL